MKSLCIKFTLLPFLLFVGLEGFAQNPAPREYPLITVKEVNRVVYDTFRIKAIVKDIHICPPCPKGAICKPCSGDHLLVADLHGTSGEWLQVFAGKPGEFVKEKCCTFTLRLSNKANPGYGIVLIAFEPSNREIR